MALAVAVAVSSGACSSPSLSAAGAGGKTGSPRSASASQRPTPVLGEVWASNQQGYGQAHPTTVFNGGDPTGLIRQIIWHSWGGPRAEGNGIGLYVPATAAVAEGTEQPVHIVAFDLGSCRGHLVYRAVEWYFPQHGQSFNPHQFIDICHGTYVGP